MGKVKSAICLTLITLIVAVLGVLSTVSIEFDTAAGKAYNSFISYMKKDAVFGNELKNGAYVGGGYVTVYYPEGVISAEEYEANLAAYGSDAEGKAEYEDKYTRHEGGAIYLETETVYNEEGTAISEAFKTSFANNVKALQERYEQSRIPGVKLEIADEYTVRVTLPSMESAASAYVSFYAYAGEATIAYGTADAVLGESDKTISDYIKGASSQTVQDVSYVIIDFTKEGRELVKAATAGAAETASTLFINVGDQSVIQLSVNEEIDQKSLFISGSYTDETAGAVATLIDQSVNGTQADLAMTVDKSAAFEAEGGNNALLFVYIGVGVLFLAMVVFFAVRYHALAITQVYAFLIFLIATIISLAFIPFVYLGVGTIAAFALTAVLLCVSNAASFEYAKKEYALGKTMTSSVKTGYKKCFWHLFDLHVILALAAFIVAAIATTELQVFAFMLGLGTVFSGVCSLLISRFMWAITMGFSKKQGSFCNFKKEEVEEDD